MGELVDLNSERTRRRPKGYLWLLGQNGAANPIPIDSFKLTINNAAAPSTTPNYWPPPNAAAEPFRFDPIP